MKPTLESRQRRRKTYKNFRFHSSEIQNFRVIVMGKLKMLEHFLTLNFVSLVLILFCTACGLIVGGVGGRAGASRSLHQALGNESRAHGLWGPPKSVPKGQRRKVSSSFCQTPKEVNLSWC